MKLLKNTYFYKAYGKSGAIGIFILLAVILTGCVLNKSYRSFAPPKDAPLHTVSMIDSYKYGEILHCKLGTGSAFIDEKWLDIKEREFLIIKNGRSNVTIHSRYNRDKYISMQSIFDHEGQKITLCPLLSLGENKKVECLNLYTLDADLELSIKRAVNLSNFIRGSLISCAYDKSKLQALTPSE